MGTHSMIRLAARRSPLSRWQAQWVANRLTPHGVVVELVWIDTTGDRRQEPIAGLGTTGVFTKEIQRAVLEGSADVAVHSLKDLPTESVPGLVLAAVPSRGPRGDAFVSRDNRRLDELPAGSLVATSSRRRRSQLLSLRPDLRVCDVRGNVGTRLEKLARGDFDAMVLAEAGLRRLGLDGHICHIVPPDKMLPAVGQGALGLETRADDQRVQEAVSLLDHRITRAEVTAERAVLAALHAGCLAPVGALTRVDDSAKLFLRADVLSLDGQRRLTAQQTASADQAQQLGAAVAEELLRNGARDLVHQARGGSAGGG